MGKQLPNVMCSRPMVPLSLNLMCCMATLHPLVTLPQSSLLKWWVMNILCASLGRWLSDRCMTVVILVEKTLLGPNVRSDCTLVVSICCSSLHILRLTPVRRSRVCS